MTEKDLDIAIEKCERIMEFDTRTLKNPESENGYIFEKVYDLLKFLRQFQFETGGMDDTISRQAAIDAFAPYAEYESNRTNKEWVRRINMVLSALPPAQPGWIPCSERCPERYDNYLITTEDGMVVFGVYDLREKQWCRYDSIKSWWIYGIKVLAWQPLPKPWEGEKS